MTRSSDWVKLTPNELHELYNSSSSIEFSSFFPMGNCSAIYIWKLTLRDFPFDGSNKENLLHSIQTLISHPIAIMNGVRSSKMVTIPKIEIKRSQLGDTKLETLQALCSSEKGRKYLIDYLKNVSDFLPPVYVGETKQLFQRIDQHLRGNTELLPYVINDLGFDLSYLEFYYLRTGPPGTDDEQDKDKQIRKLLEHVGQMLLFAPAVKRPG